jgi:hypothetical protein
MGSEVAKVLFNKVWKFIGGVFATAKSATAPMNGC